MSQYDFFDNYGFSSNLWAPLLTDTHVKKYKTGSYIYLQGQSPDYFYYIKNGVVKSLISSESGAEKVLTVYRSGSIFGEASFFDETPRMSSACAVEDCGIVVFDRATVTQRLVNSPELVMTMLKYLSRTVRILSTQVDSMTFLQTDKRIARWLIQAADTECVIRSSHEEISAIVGASRVTVSRILSAFSKRSWIKTGYKQLEILNRDALERFAEEL